MLKICLVSELKCRFCEAAPPTQTRLNTLASNISIGDNFSTFQRGSKRPARPGYLSQGEKRRTIPTDPPQYLAWYWDLQWNNTRFTDPHSPPLSPARTVACSLPPSLPPVSSLFISSIKIFPALPCISRSKHGSICLQSGPTIDISELKWRWSVWPDSLADCLIISASSSPLSQHQKEANQAQYFGGCWRKCLIRYFNILFSHSGKEFQDLDEMIST